MPAILAQEGGNEVREVVLFDCSRAVAVGGAGLGFEMRWGKNCEQK